MRRTRALSGGAVQRTLIATVLLTGFMLFAGPVPPPTPLRGTVTDATTQKALAGVQVVAEDEVAKLDVAESKTDAAGRYAIYLAGTYSPPWPPKPQSLFHRLRTRFGPRVMPKPTHFRVSFSKHDYSSTSLPWPTPDDDDACGCPSMRLDAQLRRVAQE